jgi:hypothetical protein
MVTRISYVGYDAQLNTNLRQNMSVGCDEELYEKFNFAFGKDYQIPLTRSFIAQSGIKI